MLVIHQQLVHIFRSEENQTFLCWNKCTDDRTGMKQKISALIFCSAM